MAKAKDGIGGMSAFPSLADERGLGSRLGRRERIEVSSRLRRSRERRNRYTFP